MSNKNTPKLCRYCVHCNFTLSADRSRCLKNIEYTNDTDLVTGKVTKRRVNIDGPCLCSYSRYDKNLCGQEGKWYEPIKKYSFKWLLRKIGF